MSITADQLKAGMVVDITPVTHLLASDYKAVKVLGVVGFDIAKTFGSIETMHYNISSDLPASTPRNPRDYNYVLLERTVGVTPGESNKIVMGVPWIGTVTVVGNVSYRVNVSKTPSENGEQLIARALQAYGITDFTIERSN